MSKPPVLHRQLDRCQVCGTKIHRHKLVRTQVRFKKPEGSNYCLYSSYDSTFWKVTAATDRSTIGYGPHGDEQRMRIPDSNTPAYVNCARTWSEVGLFRSWTTAMDVSALTNITMSMEVAPVISYSGSRTEFDDALAACPSLTVVMGLCDSDGLNRTTEDTWSDVKSQTRCWFTKNVSTIASPLSSSGIYVYATVTPDPVTGYWLIDDMSLEADKTSPDTFIRTTGAAVTNSTDTKSMTVVKVCPDCYEPLLLESEQFGRPQEIRNEPPVTPMIQDV